MPIDAFDVTCALCLTTSVGTRTRHAANSPILALRLSVQTAKYNQFVCKENNLHSRLNIDLIDEYVTKNRAEPGADPNATDPIPL